jgi:hypothetical protein
MATRRRKIAAEVKSGAMIAGKETRVLNPSVSKNVVTLFESFRGRKSKPLYRAIGHPSIKKLLAELGGLVRLNLTNGQAMSFDERTTKLAADGDGNLYIVVRAGGGRDGMFMDNNEKPLWPQDWQEGRRYLIGEIAQVTYSADKPHIEETDEVGNYFHDFEAERPKLYFKDGFLLIVGGDYELTKDGIVG